MRPRRPLRRRQGCQLRCCPLRRERRAAPRANAAPKALTSPQWSLPAKRRGSRARPNGKNHPATKKLAYPDGAVPGPCGAGSEQARFRRARTSPARAPPPNDGCTANPWHSIMARSRVTQYSAGASVRGFLPVRTRTPTRRICRWCSRNTDLEIEIPATFL